MYVIEIIPLRKGIQIDSLSYFSAEEYPRGSLVTVPLRNKETLGIVINTSEVNAAKTALRAATFSLRRLPPQDKVQTLSPAYIETAEELALYYASSAGAVLFSMLAPVIKNGDITLPRTHHVVTTETHTPEVLSAKKDARLLAYRSLVRETFAHGGSVLIVVPTSAEVDELERGLAAGIEDRTILLTSTLPKKKLREEYEALEDFSKPKLIIATLPHSILERHDITLTIIEHERSPYFKMRTRPYLDYRDVLLVHAKHCGRKILFGDLLLRTETEQKRRAEEYLTYGEVPKRIEFKGKLERIEMALKPDGSEPFKLFSPTVIDAIRETKKRKGFTFLFAARRGLAPVVACIDCGFIFRSPESGAPYSLVRTVKNGVEERWFVCGSSGHRERASDTCSLCGSWRLREKGIGIQYVYDELTKELGTPIILFDHLTAGTYKKACFLRNTFFKNTGGIMLGTQMALPYLNKQVETSVVVNMDALYATPTWRLQEETLGVLLSLREKTDGTVYIQTRTKEDGLLREARQGSLEHFYNNEIESRKTFNYPPFTIFIHLTWQGSRDVLKKIEAVVEKILHGYELSLYFGPPSPKGTMTQYGLLRIAAQDWPDKKMSLSLRALPPSVRITLNPDKII